MQEDKEKTADKEDVENVKAGVPDQGKIRDSKGHWLPGVSGCLDGPGKGVVHKRVAVREQALAALDMLNDRSEKASWLYDLAIKDPRTYASILAKTMPKDVTIDATITAKDPKLANKELLERCEAITKALGCSESEDNACNDA